MPAFAGLRESEDGCYRQCWSSSKVVLCERLGLALARGLKQHRAVKWVREGTFGDGAGIATVAFLGENGKYASRRGHLLAVGSRSRPSYPSP